MRNWFTSRNGALTLSALSLLAFIGYTLMEMRFFLADWIPGNSAAMIETVVILLIAGGWLWALFAADHGRRSGLTALLACSGFAVLVALYDLQYVFGTALPWPEQTMILVMLGLALPAIVALWIQRRQSQRAA